MKRVSADLSGQRLGHYRVEGVLGRGGMSIVYRAVDERLGRAVALKVMSENLSADPEFRTRFVGEARAASAIDHVNVVPLYEFGDSGGHLFIAMRLVDGTDLARELQQGPLAPRRALQLLGQVGAALDMLHQHGLVHLDVKPANVLITRNELVGTEHVYVADFGLTRGDGNGHRTRTGDFLGSPTYASPEHLRGQDLDASTDEYSLTCMLFAALAGRPPFVGDVRTVITGHLTGTVPSLAALTGLPPTIDRVIARGMGHDPGQRYPTSADLLGAARRALSVGLDPLPAATTTVYAPDPPTGPIFVPALAPVPPAPPPLPHRPVSHREQRVARPRWPWWVGGSGLVVIAAVVLIVLFLRRDPISPTPGPAIPTSTASVPAAPVWTSGLSRISG